MLSPENMGATSVIRPARSRQDFETPARVRTALETAGDPVDVYADAEVGEPVGWRGGTYPAPGAGRGLSTEMRALVRTPLSRAGFGFTEDRTDRAFRWTVGGRHVMSPRDLFPNAPFAAPATEDQIGGTRARRAPSGPASPVCGRATAA